MDSEAIVLLRRIAVAVEKLAGMLPAGASQARQVPAPGPARQSVANDADLDSKFGDEQIRFNPRDWTGQSFVGRRMSECSAPFLDALAKVYDHFAAKNETANAMTEQGKPKWVFDQRTASRARGWAARVRAGHVSRQPGEDDGEPGTSDFGGPDLPFAWLVPMVLGGLSLWA